VVEIRERTATVGWRDDVVVPQEPDEVGQTLGNSRPSAITCAGEPVEILLDERFIDLSNRTSLSCKPLSELMTVT
jgi:hypothetical protein